MRRLLLIFAALSAIGLSVWLLARPGDAPLFGDGPPDAYSREAFDKWVISDPNRHAEFEAFTEFLAAHEVGNVVPAWQLMRTDANRFKDCERPAFLLPPREDWPNIVPVLALVRDQIVPEIGAVEVQSSYRTGDFNECLGGASQSRHLTFSAVDLTPIEDMSNPDLFRSLCAVQRDLGQDSNFGLGAYFDPAKPGKGNGRFHVDVSGYRSWGYSQHADSSGCRVFTRG
ncbi:MAG: hypothetical protein H6913_02325 [Altererythrobacter sp.]|nr:hypothetical protein [Altererythrobacter sp.]